jgi:Fe-only nitrogenase accessory protein AnfO
MASDKQSVLKNTKRREDQMQIAVLMNELEETGTFGESGKLKVFEYLGDHWEIIREVNYDITETEGMNGMRAQLKALGDAVTPCRNLVAAKLNGLAYTTYEVMGFQLWEIAGKPDLFLDQVRMQEIERMESETRVDEIPLPTPEATETQGVYFLDLEKAKMHYTSKQVLYPFLKSGDFKLLKLLCSHVPPWFERELSKMGYRFKDERTEDRQYIVYIEPN